MYVCVCVCVHVYLYTYNQQCFFTHFTLPYTLHGIKVLWEKHDRSLCLQVQGSVFSDLLLPWDAECWSNTWVLGALCYQPCLIGGRSSCCHLTQFFAVLHAPSHTGASPGIDDMVRRSWVCWKCLSAFTWCLVTQSRTVYSYRGAEGHLVS